MVDDLNLFDICCVSDVTFRPKDKSFFFRSLRKKLLKSLTKVCVVLHISARSYPIAEILAPQLYHFLRSF